MGPVKNLDAYLAHPIAEIPTRTQLTWEIFDQSLTWNPTQAKSKNPKPNPRAEKLIKPTTTSPIAHNSIKVLQ